MIQPQEFRALLIYSMSGGNPATLEMMIRRLRLNEEMRARPSQPQLSEGGTKAAATRAGEGEPLKEKPELGAFLALVKGSVLVQEKPADALKFLEQARLISPARLSTRPPLRRSHAAPHCREGHQAFPDRVRSVCALLPSLSLCQPVRRRPCAGVIELHETIDLEKLESVIGVMSPEQQQVVYLRIARPPPSTASRSCRSSPTIA